MPFGFNAGSSVRNKRNYAYLLAQLLHILSTINKVKNHFKMIK